MKMKIINKIKIKFAMILKKATNNRKVTVTDNLIQEALANDEIEYSPKKTNKIVSKASIQK